MKIKYVFLFGALGILLSCSTTQLVSNKDPNFNGSIERLYIIIDVGNITGLGELFLNNVQKPFEKADVIVKVKGNTGVELNNDVAISEIKDFNPDSILKIGLTEGVIDSWGRLINGNFDFSIYNPETSNRIWRAISRYDTGFLAKGTIFQGINASTVNDMLDAVIKKLKDDNMLSKSVKPKTSTNINESVDETIKKKESTSLESDTTADKDGFRDDFSESTLNGRWRWVREPIAWNLYSEVGFLKIIVADRPLNMLLANAPSGDFQVDLKMQLRQSGSRGCSAGLIITSDSGDSASLRLAFEPEHHGGLCILFSTSVDVYRTYYSSNAFLRLIKKGNKVEGFYCSDGYTYNSIGELDFNSKTNLKLGIATGDFFGGSVVALFDYIMVTPQ
jgi:hypothetical protein